MMPFETANSIPAWPAMTRGLRNAKCIARGGLQHTRVYALPLSQLEGNCLRNSVKTNCFSRSTRPPSLIRPPLQIPQPAQDLYTSPQHMSRACHHAKLCQPICLDNVLCHGFSSKPKACTWTVQSVCVFAVRTDPSPVGMSDIRPCVSGTRYSPVSSTPLPVFSKSCSGSA